MVLWEKFVRARHSKRCTFPSQTQDVGCGALPWTSLVMESSPIIAALILPTDIRGSSIVEKFR
jgi:hypothetical protein